MAKSEPTLQSFDDAPRKLTPRELASKRFELQFAKRKASADAGVKNPAVVTYPAPAPRRRGIGAFGLRARIVRRARPGRRGGR